MRRSLLPTILLLICLIIPACTENKPVEPPPPWKVKQIKLVNDLIDRYSKKAKLDDLFCDPNPVIDFGEVKSWQIIDDREVSPQVGKLLVKLSKLANLNPYQPPQLPQTQTTKQKPAPKNENEIICEVTVFRITEFEEEFCVHKVVEKEPAAEEPTEQ